MATFRPRPPMHPLEVLGRGADVEPNRIPVPVTRAIVDCAVYVDGARIPGQYTPTAAVDRVCELEAAEQRGFIWIGLHEPDTRQMQAIADLFHLHPLAVEDAVQAHQRP